MEQSTRTVITQGRGYVDRFDDVEEFGFVEITIQIEDDYLDDPAASDVILVYTEQNSALHKIADAAYWDEARVEWRVEDRWPVDRRPGSYNPSPLSRISVIEPLPDPDGVIVPDFPPPA